MYVTRTTLREALWRWRRGIARACRWRHDGVVMPGGKRGLSPVIRLSAPIHATTHAASRPVAAARARLSICCMPPRGVWNH